MSAVLPLDRLSPESQRRVIQRLVQAGMALDSRQPLAGQLPLREIDFVATSDGRDRSDDSGTACGASAGGSHDARALSACRLCFWPAGRPPGPLTAVVSSRLGRQLSGKSDWFLHLRTLCRQAAAEKSVLVGAPGTTTAPFVRRACHLFGVPRCDLTFPRSGESLPAWWKRCRALSPPRTEGGGRPPDRIHCTRFEACLSPALWPSADGGGATALPATDAWMIAMAATVVALYVRPNGRIFRLLMERLQWTGAGRPDVYLALSRQLTPLDVRDQLLERGAVGRLLLAGRRGPLQTSKAARPPGGNRRTMAAVRPTRLRSRRLASCSPWTMLTHCTRGSWGPWPDEAEQEYLDQLILTGPQADRSAFSTLLRIVRTRRLLASSRVIRGSVAAISFTEVPLHALHELRVYRSHLGHWDFEPYGICIERALLESLGARPVIYTHREAWQELPAQDRPFYQLLHSTTATGRVLDWQKEREWRLLGDLDLDTVPADQALLFVATRQEACVLQAQSPWPVIALRPAGTRHGALRR